MYFKVLILICRMIFSSAFPNYDKLDYKQYITANTIILNRSIERFRVILLNFIVMFYFFMTPVPNNLLPERKSHFATYDIGLIYTHLCVLSGFDEHCICTMNSQLNILNSKQRKRRQYIIIVIVIRYTYIYV